MSSSSYQPHSDDDDNDVIMQEDEDEASSPSSCPLYTRPIFYRQTRKRGKILKTVTERYLRHDLGLGCYYSTEAATSNKKTKKKKQHVAGVDKVHGRPVVMETPEALLQQLVLNSSADENVDSDCCLVVCDTNVLLHNMDFLEQAVIHQVMPNVVIPQTALQECRANRMVAYDRTVDLLRSIDTTTTDKNHKNTKCTIFFPDPHHVETAMTENTNKSSSSSLASSPNDENDARIRRVAEFYGQQLHGSGVQVILLSDDVALRKQAAKDAAKKTAAAAESSTDGHYQAKSVREWAAVLQARYEKQQRQRSSSGTSTASTTTSSLNLMDLVAQVGVKESSLAAGSSENANQLLFASHLAPAQLSRGVQTGLYHRGVLRSSPSAGSDYYSNDDPHQTALVTIRRGSERVAVTIVGSRDRNRALDGDVVAIELHPLEQWISTSSTSTGSAVTASSTTTSSSSKTTATTATATAGIASDTAEPTLGELTNVPEAMAVNNQTARTGTTTTATTSLRPTGKVVGILRRNFDNQSGSIFTTQSSSLTAATTTSSSSQQQQRQEEQIATQWERPHADGTTTCVFFPVNRKVPPVLIRTTQRDRLQGQRIVVALDSWSATSPYPAGHYVRTIGPTGDKAVETAVLLQQHDIPCDPFPAAVLACLPAADYSIQPEPGRRLDLRHVPVLSIDPPGCKDIDDALHCTVLPNGNYQMGVHIADVTHYVLPGTAMDLEAANRSTSTYLVNQRLDMLPGLLTTDLCSLKSNVDRYAFSVLWEVTPEAEIISVEFHKSIIHSIAALTYQQAQSYIDQPDSDTENDIQASAVKRLAQLARKFRQRRIDAGALTLASPEVKFVLDSESLNPTDVQSYTLLEANAVVEEFMLLANVTVSKKILRHYPTLSVLRRHPAPNRSMFDGLISKAKTIGLELHIDDSKQLADSLNAATVESDPYINKLLRILSTRCMSPAQYFCSGEFRPTEWHHYGLAAPVYTHFTSPIRRYADVCVHRLLAAAIGVAPLPTRLSSKSYLHDLCANMNRRHRAAQLAGRASVQLHTLIFFAGDDDSNDKDGAGGKEEDAYVLDVNTEASSEPSFAVMVPRYGIEGRVKLGSMLLSGSNDKRRVERFPEEHRIVVHYGKDDDDPNNAEPSSLEVKVFDKVRVRIWVRQSSSSQAGDPHQQRELVIDLVRPAAAGAGAVGPGKTSSPSSATAAVATTITGAGTKRDRDDENTNTGADGPPRNESAKKRKKKKR